MDEDENSWPPAPTEKPSSTQDIHDLKSLLEALEPPSRRDETWGMILVALGIAVLLIFLYTVFH